MARRVREHAWGATPVGPRADWPASLTAIVEMLLSSGFAMAVFWGRDLIQIYNDAYGELLGDKHPAGLGQTARECWPEFWSVTEPVFERVRAGETVTSFDVLWPMMRDGRLEDRWFSSSYSPLRDESGTVAGALVTILETTERMRSEAALRASEQRFRTLVQNVRDYAIFMLDADGNVTEWTEGAARVMGYRAGEVVGRSAARFYTSADQDFGLPATDLELARASGQYRANGWRRRGDDTLFRADDLATAIVDGSGTIVGFTKVVRDLSEQEEMQQQREVLLSETLAAHAEAERANHAKDEFLITLSHELRTPLAPILLWARALRGGTVPPADVPHAIDAIVRSAESQQQLIEDLRDLSRLKSGRVSLDLRPNVVAEVAQAAVDVILPEARGKHVSVTLEVAPDLGSAVFDRGRFQQVLWNLLSNAVKFTPEGGRVELRVRKHRDQIEAVVTDNGQGIEPDFLPHVFERFRQAGPREQRQPGLGVGLALCRHLVELHRGSVSGHSDGPGRGAAFTVSIPWIWPPPETDRDAGIAAALDDLPAALEGLKVLLVEDDDNMRDIMRFTLEGAGAAVLGVASASEALSLLEAGDRSGSAPDVMVCDLGLPGMDGYDLIQRIGEHRRTHGGKAIPACAVSAFARDADRDRAIDAGFDSYLAKPMTAQRLIEAVEELAAVAAECA